MDIRLSEFGKKLEVKIDDGEISEFSLEVGYTHYLSTESIDEDERYMLRYKEITIEMELKELVTPKGLEELRSQCSQ